MKNNAADLSIHQVETALPYTRFSREMLTAFVRHKLSSTTQKVYLFLILNQDLNRGNSHNLKIEDIAEELDIHPITVYKAIARLTETGLFIPKKWGSVMGSLPHSQLAKITANQVQHEKRERQFYQALRALIDEHEKINGVIATRVVVQQAFVSLVGERKEQGKYYPKDPNARRKVFDNLDLYAPSEGSELYAGIEV